MFLQEILIPICASSSPAFCIMYSAYKSLSAYRVIISNLVLYAYTLVMKFWVLASQFCMSILSSIHTQHVRVLSLAFKHFFHITFMLCDICDYVIGFITQHQYSFIHQNLITWLYLWFIIFPHSRYVFFKQYIQWDLTWSLLHIKAQYGDGDNYYYCFIKY